MRRDEFLSRLRAKYPNLGFEVDPHNPDAVAMAPAGVPSVLQDLRDDPETRMHYMEFITATDRPPTDIALLYSLYSYEHRHRLALKVTVPRDCPEIASVAHLWQNADWNEREVYDLFGVFFMGHPDLRRIMMPEDWEGHPLRKDYLHPNLAVRPD